MQRQAPRARRGGRPRRPLALLLGSALLAASLAVGGTAVPAAGSEAKPCSSSGGACGARTSRLLAYFDEKVAGGSFGFVLAGAGGPVLASLRPDEGFYPASSIKVLYLLEAVRWALSRDDPQAAWRTLLPVDSEGCGGGTRSWETLDSILLAMMRRSDNLRANAVGDFFGLDAINRTARDLGGVGPASFVVHRFACGGPDNDPANRMTAAELAGVYERYGEGVLLDPAASFRFAGYFLGAETGALDAVIAEEAAALGRADLAGALAGRIALIYKAGWWGTDLSIGGYAALPRRGCGAVHMQGLAFAAFIADADGVAAGFVIDQAAGEILREEIRAALLMLSGSAGACRASWAPRPG